MIDSWLGECVAISQKKPQKKCQKKRKKIAEKFGERKKRDNFALAIEGH